MHENLERLLEGNGLRARPWREGDDFGALAAIINKSRVADGVDDVISTAQDLKANFEDPKDFVPERDVLLLERDGALVGSCRMHWEERPNGNIVFIHSVELIPEARSEGVLKALFRYNEGHAREIAPLVARIGKKASLLLWANDAPNEWRDIARTQGYKPVQHVVSMIRPLDRLPSVSFPKGFELKKIPQDGYRDIWKARRTACSGEWDFSEKEWDDRHFKKWLRSEEFQPELWQVAYQGDTVAGMVLNFILHSENKEFGTKRGHTEHVYVASPFRRRGLARALLASSFRVLKEQGMEVAALDTEVENPNETVKLYGSVGFKVIKSFTFYQKPI